MRRRLPPLRALEAFEAVAAERSMTAAAHRLHLTVSAVSRQIRSVEDYLGEPLLLRAPGRLTLTPAGLALLPAVHAAMNHLERTAEAIRAGPPPVGLVVACDPTLALRWLIPRLPTFAASGGVRIELRTGEVADAAGLPPPHVVLAWRDPGAAPPDADTLMAERFGPVCNGVLASRWATGTGAPALDLPRLHVRTWPQAWSRWAERVGAPRAADPASDAGLYPELFLALQAAEAGLGAAIAPLALVAPDLQAGRLVAPWNFVASGRVLVAHCPSRRPATRRVIQAQARFRAWLRAQAQPPSP